MLKKLIPSALTLALSLMGLSASAQPQPLRTLKQQPANERGANWCGAVAEQERYFAAHPGAREAQQEMYQKLAAMAAQQQNKTSYVTDVTIPVVVHIIHAGGADNISDRQINSAIAQLNTDYQKLNGDTANTLPFFRPRAAAIGFQFRLAKKDPNGACTTGITRHYAPNLVNDDQSGSVQSLVIWDRQRYLNIWIVTSIGTQQPGGGIVLGYSNLPQNSTPQRDGFVARHDWFGDQGTSSPARAQSRTATHEIGHYFGLSHPWGQTNNPGTGNCNGDDGVADTPKTDGTFNCDLTYSPCTDPAGQPILANVQNIMDYASCPTMFTQGQKALMRNVLAVRPERTGLSTAANLIATGTNDGYVAQSCAPVAAFAPEVGSTTSVCINSPVKLKDYSYNFSSAGGAVTYNWSFPGGTPATATGATVSVSYAAAGFYPVTETVSNSAGTNTTTVTNYIRVEGPTGGERAPFTESFEGASFPNLYPEPTLRNYITSGFNAAGLAVANYRWVRQASLPAATGSAYLTVPNRVLPAGAIAQLITPNIDISSITGPASLRFSRAFALRSITTNEQLRISFSNDCGTSWSSPAVLNAAALTTQGLTPNDGFVPTSAADWQTLTVPIPAQFQGSGLFKVRFQMVNGTSAGNTFYFDDLSVSGPLATKAATLASRGISVYPNPLTSETAVHLNLTTHTQVQVRLTDVMGRNVVALPAKSYGAGQQSVSLHSAGQALKAGLYVVHISLNGETLTSKIVVE